MRILQWTRSFSLDLGIAMLATAFAAVLADEGAAPAAWAPPGISSPAFESHAAFDPLTGDFYFVRSSPTFEGWRLKVSHCTAVGWSEPLDPPFAGDGVEADPWFTPDGRTLYFISTRSTDGLRRKDLDIWRIHRDGGDRWTAPQRLPAPVNSDAQEWFPRLARDGWLYFGSGRSGGHGKTDIWRAREKPDHSWQIENLGEAINSRADEYEAEISRDGAQMVIMAEDGLYESTYRNGRWQPRRKMSVAVNVNATEVGALFSPSGRSLLFARDTKGPLSGEFFLLRRGRPESWPPTCARGKSSELRSSP